MTVVTALAVISLFLAYSYPFHLTPWPTFFNEWSFACFVALSLLSISNDGHLKQAIPWPWGLALVFISAHFLLFLLLQNANSLLREQFWVTLAFIAVGYTAFLLGRNLDKANLITKPLRVIWAAAALAAMVAILQYLGTFASQQWNLGLVLFLQDGSRAASLIGQSNQLGTLLVIGCWTVGFAWYSTHRSLAWRATALACIALFAYGIHLSGSRTAVLNLLLAPLLVLAWCKFNRQSYRLALLAAVPAACWLAIQSAEWFFHLMSFSEAANSANKAGILAGGRSLTQDATRFRVWELALSAIAEHPWLGQGYRGLAITQLQMSPEIGGFGNSIFYNAHNLFLELWVSYGIPFGTALAAGVILPWAVAWRRCNTASQHFIWLMCSAMLVHAMLEYPLHYGYFFWLYCMLLGHLLARPEDKVIIIKHPTLTSLTWLGASGAALYITWAAYVETEAVYTQARTQSVQVAQNSLRELAPLTKALFHNELSNLEWQIKDIRDAADWSTETVAELTYVATRRPTPALLWKTTLVHGLRNDVTQASWWAQRICAMYGPKNCTEAKEAWQSFGQSRTQWPALAWEEWINPQS